MPERSDLVRTYGLDSAAIERLVQLATENAFESILVTTAHREADGHPIVFINSSFSAMTGYSEEDVVGRTAKMFQGPRTDREMLAQLRLAIGKGRPFHGQAINYRKDGREYLVEWHIFPIRNKESKITHFASIQRDVTPTDGV